MSEGARVGVIRGAIGKEVKHGGLTLGVESVEERAAAPATFWSASAKSVSGVRARVNP